MRMSIFLMLATTFFVASPSFAEEPSDSREKHIEESIVKPDAAVSDEPYARSKDTHAIDDFPDFNRQEQSAEDPTKDVEATANRQIQESITNDAEQQLAPRTSGKVFVNAKEKLDVAKEATKIEQEDTNSTENRINAEKTRHRPSIALALGGGGARGTAHIGVLRVLKEAGIPIDYIVGNSMGSIIGGLYAAGKPLDDIQKIMLDNSLKQAYFPGMVPPKILISPLAKLMHPWKKHYAGLWTGKKFSQFLEAQLPKNVVNVEDTPIPFSAVATNLIDGKAYRISNGRLSTAIRASSTIPPLLQPVAIGDRVYVDGGVRANLPASAAKDTGADIVIAVLVDEPLKDVPAKRFRHISGIAERMGDVVLAIADARQLPFADVIINPDVSGLPVISASPEDAKKAISAGELAARKAIPDIRRKIAEVMKKKAVAGVPWHW